MAGRSWRAGGCAFLVAAALACADSSTDPGSDPGTDKPEDTLPIPLAGGATTVFDATSQAFSKPAANLAGDRLQSFLVGEQGFDASFTPAGDGVDQGLGPLFNEHSCRSCHQEGGRTPGARLLRLSVPGTDPNGGPVPVPGFGLQLQDRGTPGVEPEGQLDIRWERSSGTFSDGATFELRTPRVEIRRPYTALPTHLFSIRTPRPMVGLGLLDAISEATLQGLADPGDSDGDGISGRINMVWDATSGAPAVGRFGWKANEPSVFHQAARAYVEDMGVTTSLFPNDPGADQAGHDDGLDDDPELDDERMDEVSFYTATVAVPARRDVNDPAVRHGEALFDTLGCTRCHVPMLQTGTSPDFPELSGQTIYPYTDLLLHDMGDGLADGRPDFDASGSEWRTPPLWGLGLASVVNARPAFLHDGRAESLTEAIVWHGGEAEAARTAFMALAADARAALLRFLASL